jgi:hypothetical protein
MLADATAKLSDQLNLCCTHGSVGRTDVLDLSLAFANGILGGQAGRVWPRGSFSLQSGQSPVSAFDANQ